MIHRNNHQAAAWAGAVGTVVLGAAAMYAFDPQRGRRRRAIARDRVRHFATDVGEYAGAAVRDAAHRARGLRARAFHSSLASEVPGLLRGTRPVRESAAWSSTLRDAAIVGGLLLIACGAIGAVRRHQAF